MYATDNSTLWAKIGHISHVSFIGKDVIFFGAGCHVIFINLHTNTETMYTANHTAVGDGIRCLAGHRSQNVFAFTECCGNPRIFIRTYPDFEEICTLRDEECADYVFTVFSETSLFCTLSDMPNFLITIWNWRLGEKIASKPGTIRLHEQILRCNLSSPVIVAQLGVNTNKLHVWDIHICGKKCVLTQHVVKVPQRMYPFTSLLWTTEGALFILDTRANVYTMLPDHTLEKVINFQNIYSTLNTSFAWFKAGIVVSGPNQEIRHYKKVGHWVNDWSMIPRKPIEKIVARLDNLIVIATNHDLLQAIHTQTDDEFRVIKENETQFNDICLVQPVGEYFLALQRNSMITCFEVETGKVISTLSLKGNALVLMENPKFPYAAIGFDDGVMKLISAYKSKHLTRMAQFHLARDPIDSIYFNECGTIFVAASLRTGLLFILEGLPGSEIQILANVEMHRQVANYMLVISQNCYRLFTLPVTSDKYIAGDRIIRYCIIDGKKRDVKEYHFEKENTMYTQLCATTLLTRDRIFYAVPLFSKKIHEIEIKRGQDIAKVTQTLETGHQLREVHVKLDKKCALTWAYDGFIILKDANFQENIGMVLNHHRMNCGTKKALVDPYQKHIVSLGKDHVVACTELVDIEVDPDLQDELKELLKSMTYKMLFTHKTTGFVPTGNLEGKCYLEVKALNKIENEYQLCMKEKNAIMLEFRTIRKELQHLLTENIRGPDNEKLSFQEFNLDTKLFDLKSERNRKLCKATEIYLKKLLEEQDRISQYLMENCWAPMHVHCTAIKAIFANFDVFNYTLFDPDAALEEFRAWTQYQRKLENYLNDNASFQPWKPMLADELVALISTKPHYTKEQQIDMTAIEDEENLEVAAESQETQIAFSGSDLPRFIDVDPCHYFQNELQTYFQTELEYIISKADCHKLKLKFNKDFDALMTQKTKEMLNLKERNARLRHIISEINYFSTDQIQISILDPEWCQIENPQLITEVKDDEVPITPYISPSEQSLLNAAVAEAERLRLLLLADDFRERALMVMMNGVLEVRWEDELKKEVPLPKCMIEKQPEQFNEDDLRAVRDYEEKVKFLCSERERYKNMLKIEYKKVGNGVRENIKKFNGRLNDLLLLKLLIDATLSQETLKVENTKLHQHKIHMLNKQELEVDEKIKDNENVIESLHKLISSLHHSLVECRSVLDGFQSKDKILEKAFRKDFQDMSIVIQEQTTKLYRKRPKINIKSINSTTLLEELSKCITTNLRPLTLTSECLDFLRNLDTLDMYVGVSPAVDEHAYHLMCRHRRLRIEYEIKLRAANNTIIEAETTIGAFHKRLNVKKELAIKLQADLAKIRADIVNLQLDSNVQIVLPLGFVECETTGSMQDFENAVLICRKDIDDINKIILQEGQKKLKALRQAIGFRRKIIAMEWLHKKMRMQIEDLHEKIMDTKAVKLTKEMQTFLKLKNKEKIIPFETEVEIIKGSYENTIADRREQVERMKRQINVIREHDKILDHKITEVNVDVCDFTLNKDKDLDVEERAVIDERMKTLLLRSQLVQEIQERHHEILMLQTELELLRLKTFPTIKFKILH